MKKRKDNLTDAIEVFQENNNGNNSSEGNNYEVVDNEGEIVTLGQKKRKNKLNSNKGSVIELSIKNKIEKMVKEEVEKELKGFSEKIVEKVGKKLKKAGFFKNE